MERSEKRDACPAFLSSGFVSWAARARYPPLVQARAWAPEAGRLTLLLAAEWRWPPSPRGGHSASCAGRRTGPKEHLHSEPRLRYGAALAALAAHRTISA